jgi:hypothetical protein
MSENKKTLKCKVLSSKYGLYVKNLGIIYKLHKPIQGNYKEGDEAEFDLVTNNYNGREQRTAFSHDDCFATKRNGNQQKTMSEDTGRAMLQVLNEILVAIKGG